MLNPNALYKYRVDLIHTEYDWDVSFVYTAGDPEQAKEFASMKLHRPDRWIVVSVTDITGKPSAREIIESLVACHEEPDCPAVAVARGWLEESTSD